MSRRIRVLVVDDSLTVRKHLVEVLSADSALEVVGEGADGDEAIARCRELAPDVITLDIVMPGTSGLAATEFIMAHCPTPIVIVSASTNRADLFQTYDALAAGAVDVVEKPDGTQPAANWAQNLVAAVKMASRIKVIRHPRAKLSPRKAVDTLRPPLSRRAERKGYSLVAIGASTGGPGAVNDILRALPPDFPLPVLVVIHIGAPFAASLTEWLGVQSALPVSHARSGEDLPLVGAGRVILAPPDRHLVVADRKLQLVAGPERNYCKPSIDVLFESIAVDLGGEAIACLLTGMGKDGAQGLLAVRRAGGATLAQDEATSIVFGMPREAIQLDAVDQILPLPAIATALTSLAQARSPR